jgi:hypothetical protein
MPVDLSKLIETTYDPESPIPMMSEYDPIWGYFFMTQTISFDYNETKVSAISVAQVTINGKFTSNAEFEEDIMWDETIGDIARSNKLLEKYQALRQLLISKTLQPPPEDFGDYGTQSDDRCVKLPGKLKNNVNQDVYMIPVGISTANMITPDILEYTVTLREAQKIPCKIIVEDDIIHDAVVTITCRRPRVAPRTFAFANGGEFYFSGYDNRRIKVEGILEVGGTSMPDNRTFYDGQIKFIDKISAQGEAKLGVKRSGGSTVSFGKIKLGPHSLTANKGKGENRVSIEGEQMEV